MFFSKSHACQNTHNKAKQLCMVDGQGTGIWNYKVKEKILRDFVPTNGVARSELFMQLYTSEIQNINHKRWMMGGMLACK